MDTDRQVRVLAGQGDRVVEVLLVGEQRRRADDALAEGMDNATVDPRRESEVVRVDNEPSLAHSDPAAR